MNLFERVLDIIAPHNCLNCGREGKLLCSFCVYDAFDAINSRCYRCQKVTKDFRTCPNCRHKSGLKHVWVLSEYSAAAKELLHKLKFERAVAGAEIIAEMLDDFLPYFKEDTLITYCPTSTARVRIRGYDQSKLITKSLAKKRGLLFAPLLVRIGQTRQVGAKGMKRREQLKDAFLPINKKLIKNSEIILLDDVLTTGATLEAAALALKSAGAKRVSAAVFAQSL